MVESGGSGGGSLPWAAAQARDGRGGGGGRGGVGDCGKGATRRGHVQLALLAVQRAIEVLHL